MLADDKPVDDGEIYLSIYMNMCVCVCVYIYICKLHQR